MPVEKTQKLVINPPRTLPSIHVKERHPISVNIPIHQRILTPFNFGQSKNHTHTVCSSRGNKPDHPKKLKKLETEEPVASLLSLILPCPACLPATPFLLSFGHLSSSETFVTSPSGLDPFRYPSFVPRLNASRIPPSIPP